MIKKKLWIAGFGSFFGLLVLAGVLLAFHSTAKASFNANEVVDDVVFNNINTMSAAQIDSFLNSFPDSCLSSNNGFTTPDPTGWSASVQTNNGYTFGGNVTAGQAIFDASRIYHINPEVLLATMQKEQSIVIGSGSPSSFCHYTNLSPGDACNAGVYGTVGGCVFIGMSYACPGSCDYSYNGFSLQLLASSWLLRFAEERAEGITSGYAGYDAGDSSVGYGGAQIDVPYTLPGGNTVTVVNGATAALYYYTPSFAGGEEFDTIFQNWFGPTTMTDSYFAVVCDPNGSNAWYLLTATGKYYITGAAYSEWGLSNLYPEPGCGNAANQVSQAFFDSLPTGPNLGNLLKDQWGNYFFIDNGQVHYVRDSSYLALWGLNPNAAVQSTGLVYSMLGGNWVGRFMVDITNGNTYLMDGGTAHLMSTTNGIFYNWGYISAQVTAVTDTFIQSLPNGGALTQNISNSGSDYVVDSGNVLNFPNANVQNAYGAPTELAITSSTTLSYLPQISAQQFVMDTTTGRWYMLEGGNTHYIPNLALAQDWGYQPGQALTPLSDGYISLLTSSGTLADMVQTPLSQQWVLDGQKHLIPSATVANAWIASGATLPTYSADSLNLLWQGSNLTTLLIPAGSPFVYTMDNGSKRYLANNQDVDAYAGSSTPIVSLSPNLVNQIPEISPATYIVENSSNYYLLMYATLYPIKTAYDSAWDTNTATQISNSTLARYTVSSQQLGPYLQINGAYYIMNNLQLVPVIQHLDAYGITSSNSVTLPEGYWPVVQDASYLVSPTGSSSMYLITGGQKIAFSNFAQEANYGYVSDGVPVTTLDPSIISGITTSSSPPSMLINTTNAGVKILSFGYALGFPDGNTLLNYTSTTNPILTVSPSVYNQFVLRRSTSVLLRDDSGNIYLIQNGSKDLIQNQSLLNTTYAGIPITYLEGTAIVSIPSGSPIT